MKLCGIVTLLLLIGYFVTIPSTHSAIKKPKLKTIPENVPKNVASFSSSSHSSPSSNPSPSSNVNKTIKIETQTNSEMGLTLIDVAKNGDLKKTKELLSNGKFDVNIRSTHQMT